MSTPLPTVQRDTIFENARYVTPDINDMVALGIQSRIEYRGLVFNDRLVADRYTVTEIDGLAAPDIRDNREARVGQHGEIAYDAYWGGDTLTIDGTMFAGNLFELGRMERDLRAAFGDLSAEFPMKFNWWDVHDEFSDPVTSSFMWANLAQQMVFLGDGTMRGYFATSPLSNPAMAYYALRQYVDHLTTIKFIQAPTTNGSNPLPYAGILAKCSSAATYLMVTATSTTMTIYGVVGNIVTTFATILYSAFGAEPLEAGQQAWLQMKIVDELITCLLYTEDPDLNPTAVPICNLGHYLDGEAADTFGYLQRGFSGVVIGGQNAAQQIIEDFRVDAIWPCDMVTNVRPIAAPAIKNVVQPSPDGSGGGIGTSKTRFIRDFQLMVRTSNPRITQPTQQVLLAGLSLSQATTAYGRIYPRTYPMKYIIPVDALGNLTTSTAGHVNRPFLCINRGNWLAQPIITMYGGVSFPILLNDDTGEFILLDGEIASGDYVQIDVANQRLSNSSGGDVFGLWDPASTWLQLRPLYNHFTFSGQSVVGSPYVSIAWAHTWK